MQHPPEIWLLDDDSDLRKAFSSTLLTDGYTVKEFGDPSEALARVDLGAPDLLILDIDMPGMTGFEVLHELKRRGFGFPVLMITGVNDLDSRVKGLDAGADGYVGKPCSAAELTARIRSLLRRFQEKAAVQELHLGDLRVDFRSVTADRGGVAVRLSPTDFRLLHLLGESRGQPISRDDIMDRIWGVVSGDSHVLDTHIWRLRSKLGDREPGHPWIVSVPGKGYMIPHSGT